MAREILACINWFVVTMFVSAVVFGLAGFLGGLLARSWLLAGAVPAFSFLTTNPVTRFPMAKDLPVLQKVIVIVFAQFAVCYLLVYWGARLSTRRQRHKTRTDNQDVQAVPNPAGETDRA